MLELQFVGGPNIWPVTLEAMPAAHEYGDSWIAVNAIDDHDALHQWDLYSQGRHAMQADIEAFATLYRPENDSTVERQRLFASLVRYATIVNEPSPTQSEEPAPTGIRPERVAIIGGREFPSLRLVTDYVQSLPDSAIVVTGGARGVDRAAMSTAHEWGLPYLVYPPNKRKYGPRTAPMRRNVLIVRAAHRVVAFWDGNSPGTAAAIHMALGLDRHVLVCDPGNHWRDLTEPVSRTWFVERYREIQRLSRERRRAEKAAAAS